MGSTGWPKALCGALGPYIGSRGAEQPPHSTRGVATITAIQADLSAIYASPDGVHANPRTIARHGASHCELVHKISRTASPAVIEITAATRQHLPLWASDRAVDMAMRLRRISIIWFGGWRRHGGRIDGRRLRRRRSAVFVASVVVARGALRRRPRGRRLLVGIAIVLVILFRLLSAT